jgi:MFS family permease
MAGRGPAGRIDCRLDRSGVHANRRRRWAADEGKGAMPWTAVLTSVTLTPDPGQLPGGGTLQQLANGIGGWALILALVGLVIGAAAWALGAHSQNYHQSFVGRRAVLVSGLAALLIGAAPSLINFFFGAGVGLH